MTIGSKSHLAEELRRIVLARERRTGKPVKKATLAKQVGVSASSLYAYLNGTTLPPADTLDRLLDVLAVSVAHRRFLGTARDTLDLRGTGTAPPAPPPRELPPDVFGFIGRVDELGELDSTPTIADARPRSVPIWALCGTAGVGKTALAVHWAHRIGEWFPDGQLYVDLRGYHPGEPVQPTVALEGLLHSLGVSGGGIPPDLARRAALYRTLVAHRRMLILLDNAHSTNQVRDLLPGTPSCVVVITSRNRLAGLVARHGARRVDLGPLTPAEAVELLRLLVGERVDTEPAAAAALAQRCCRLPLALRVAAELAASQPASGLADLIGDLDHHRLDVLGDADDQSTAMRAVLSWSYRHLDEDAADAFRHLGLHPGHDFEPYAVAALTGTSVWNARRLLDTLGRANLVQPSGMGRYGMHDLLHLYAAERAADIEGVARRHAARARLLDHYGYTAMLAMDAIAPYESRHRPRVPAPATPTPTLSGYTDAMAWLEAERPNLLAAAAHAATHGRPDDAGRLSATLWRYLHIRGYHDDALTLHTHALNTARATGDRTVTAQALCHLGLVYWRLDRYDEALAHNQRALALARDAGDRYIEGRSLGNLGSIYWRTGNYQEALAHDLQALELAHALSDAGLEGRALSNLGSIYWRTGRYRAALTHQARALALARETGCRALEGDALLCLGDLYSRLRRHAQALTHYQQALALARDTGDRTLEGYALSHLGELHSRIGCHPQALTHYQRTLELARDTGCRALEGDALLNLGHHLARTGYRRRAGTLYHRALVIARDTGDFGTEIQALNGLGEVSYSVGEPGRALTYHAEAFDRAKEVGDRHEEARARRGLARAHRVG